MTNFDPIIRKLLWLCIYKTKHPDGSYIWVMPWQTNDSSDIEKPYYEDESKDQVLDWFYYQVLQSEMKNEEA